MIDKNVLTDDLIIECQLCYEESSLKDWEENTFASCITREMRRKYTSLHEVKAYLKSHGASYKCPSCGGWLQGCQLTLKDKEGNTIKGVGGHEIMRGSTRK